MGRRLAIALVLVALLLSGCHHKSKARGPAAVVTVPIAGRPSAVTVAGGLVWVSDDERGVVVTVDEKTGKVVGDPIKVNTAPIALASDGTDVWVADANGSLTGITIRTRASTGIMHGAATFSGIAAARGVVWLTDVQSGNLFLVHPHDVAQPGPTQIPQGAVRVAVDGDSVWVTNGENTVTRVDARTLAVDPPITVGTGPIGLAVRDGVVWVANSEDDDVSRVTAGLTGPAPATHVAKAPIGVAAGDDAVWVISQDARRLTRLDVTTGKVLRSLAIDTRPRGIALGSDRVWIAGVEPNVVVGVLRSALGA